VHTPRIRARAWAAANRRLSVQPTRRKIMNVQRRRDFRGAFRATPEDILRKAIADHKALRDREEWQAGPAASKRAKKAAPRKTAAESRRDQFAEGLARAAFGRFYFKDRSR
jgi:hypothetical protein